MGSNGIFVGSATESSFFDLFIAIPAGTKILTNSSLTGSFWIGHMDYPGGDPSKARNSLFQVKADGAGGLGTVTVTGRDATLPTGSTSRPAAPQTVQAASYNFASDGSASLTFPPPVGVAASSALFGGTKTLYVSADGNYLLGGDPNSYEIFFGFRPLPDTASATTSAAFFGVYFYSTVDSDFSDPSNPYMISGSGSVNAFQGLKSFWHFRGGSPVSDTTYDSVHTNDVASDGSILSTYYKTVVSADGQAFLILGQSTDYSMLVGTHSRPVGTSGVVLNPLGILNAASFSPATFPVSPGELLTLFGSNLSDTNATASTLPFPTSLAGVQVNINGRFAPVYAVSSGQLSVIVPYATSGPYASIQVINNGKPSNSVTVYNRACSTGVFAVPATGNGYGAITHADFSLVTPSHPAKQGEVILVYLTGLGAVKPSVTDGAPGPTSPLSVTTANIAVYFGSSTGTVLYSGLAPGAAGLYQINAQIPADAPTGDVQLEIVGGGCDAFQVKISIAKGP